VLLAGGQSRRMGGGDKCLRPLGGKPILTRIVERVRPQVRRLILNANGDPARFADYDLTVVSDSVEGFAGPLAGVLAGLDWAAAHAPDCPVIVTVPTDAPFLPADLVECLWQAVRLQGAELACAASNGQPHPVVGLWPVQLRDDLRRAMTTEEIRKVDLWTARHRLVTVEFPAVTVDPFLNVNRPDDLAAAERLLA
jgi:molybdopterin-guanine dinucleotide biosynthesis protein A